MRARHARQGRFVQLAPLLSAAELRALARLPVAVLVRLGMLAPTPRLRRARRLGVRCDAFLVLSAIERWLIARTAWMDGPGPSEDTPAMQPAVDL